MGKTGWQERKKEGREKKEKKKGRREGWNERSSETGKKRIRKNGFIIELVMGMKSVFSDLGFSFCRYFRLLSLRYRGRVFIQTVGSCRISLALVVVVISF